jgi:molybdopterin-containing oxidoreductase family iron-sulfur binding subunit
MAHPGPPLDLDTARRRLEAAGGQDYWRSLEELADSPGFEEMLEREFPRQVGGWMEGLDRRHFLKLMGASLALAGLSGCGHQAPREPLVPYNRQPEQVVPGRPLYFATAMPLAGFGSGLLVESHEGRPTKVEGNPDHPSARLPVDSPGSALPPNSAERPRFGPSDLFAQGSILGLYDPDRAQSVTHVAANRPSSWEEFSDVLNRRLRGQSEGDVNRDLRLRILTGTVTSPSLAQQIDDILHRFPRARWHVYEPAGRDMARIGARFAFGQEVETVYHFEEAAVILSLDADFLSCGPGHLRYVRDFAARRRVRQGRDPRQMNRLYVVESTPSNTGAVADHRWPLRSAQVESFARAVAEEVGVRNIGTGAGPAHGLREEWVRAVAEDLVAQRGRSLVVAGDGQPPYVHALAHAMNRAMDNVGRTVEYLAPVEVRPREPEGAAPAAEPFASLRQLAEDMGRGEVDLLLILDSNPVCSAPADLNFAERLARVPLRVQLSLYQDETSDLCHWHIPEAHYLESWGDVRAFDGTVSIVQPLIAPLYGGRSAHDLLALLTGWQERSAYEVVRAYWRRSRAQVRRLPPGAETQPFPGDFEAWWRRAVHDGLIAGTRETRVEVRLRDDWTNAPGVPQGQGLEIVFRPDPTIFDGRFANNGWLQELPKPLSKVTWDNAAYLSPVTATRLGLAPQGNPEQSNERVVTLRYQGRSVEAPVFALPGHPDDCVTVHLGYGRTRAGRVGSSVGFNANRLRTAGSPWFGQGLTITPTSDTHQLARTQRHHSMHGRDIVRAGTVQHRPEIEPAAHEPRRTRRELPTLYPERGGEGEKWGMAIDLTLCTGCSACVVACQSENNIPVVGREQVARSREMHWIRVDTYYRGDPARPADLKTYFQPVPCQQCENAPCEVVCPVAATVHSEDGLNDMVYNRCVGTRYCSNNCPYKVRRFNFLQFADWSTEAYHAMRNPDVTVRSRGVMEKCTYCVQRIRHGQINAQLEDRAVRDGEIQTACQAACPAGAIIFGDLNGRGLGGQEHSQVHRLQAEPLSYGLLFEQNTRPRTLYLAAIKNPNPAIRTEERE